jgi:hypothetical protein
MNDLQGERELLHLANFTHRPDICVFFRHLNNRRHLPFPSSWPVRYRRTQARYLQTCDSLKKQEYGSAEHRWSTRVSVGAGCITALRSYGEKIGKWYEPPGSCTVDAEVVYPQ